MDFTKTETETRSQPKPPLPVGKNVIELEMNQRYGYFIISKPLEGWEKSKYQVKIYYGSPGQELHAVNVVGTMEFTIKE